VSLVGAQAGSPRRRHPRHRRSCVDVSIDDASRSGCLV